MRRDRTSASRRDFLRRSLFAAGALVWASQRRVRAAQAKASPLRLGGPTFEKYKDPEGWVQAVKKLGYSAAYCPVGAEASDDVVKAYTLAAESGYHHCRGRYLEQPAQSR